MINSLYNSDYRKSLIFTSDKIDVSANQVKNFVILSIENNRYLEDSFDLAIVFDIFSNRLLSIAEKKLKNSYVNGYLKLTILDFILHNIDSISESNFVSLQNNLVDSNNELLKFQSRLNISIVKKDMFEHFLKEENFLAPSFFYRFINTLESSIVLKRLFDKNKKAVMVILENSKQLKNKQRVELRERVRLLKGT